MNDLGCGHHCSIHLVFQSGRSADLPTREEMMEYTIKITRGPTTYTTTATLEDVDETVAHALSYLAPGHGTLTIERTE
jgi:hypothetical protein